MNPRIDGVSEQSAKYPKFEFVTGTNIREPITGREEIYRPWESTPLLTGNNESTKLHQAEVMQMYESLIESADLPEVTATLVRGNILSSGARQQFANQASYSDRLELIPDLTLVGEMATYHHRGLEGTANMRQLKALRAGLGMASIEFGKVTFVNKARSEHIEPMFNEFEGVLGSKINKPEPYKLEIVGFDEGFYLGKHIKSMVLWYKRLLGILDDGTIGKEESTLVVRTDRESGFDRELMLAIKRTAAVDMTHVASLRRVRPIIDDIVQYSASHPLVCAGNVKIYGYNPETAAMISERKARIREAELAKTAFDSTRIHIVGRDSVK